MVPVSKVFSYSLQSENADIALINLAADAPPNATILLVNTDLTVPADTAFVRAIGFGLTMHAGIGDKRLRQVDVPVVDLQTCRRGV